MKFPITKLNAIIKNANNIKGIVSVWGDFGVGKTTFVLQTVLNTAKNNEKVIFIYTKPNLPYEKLIALSKDSKKALDTITIIKPINFTDLNNIIFNLEFLILKNKDKIDRRLKLIVIDSITNFYRLELNQESKEKNYNLNYQLHQMLANLTYLNEIYNIEILIVNEISRKSINDQIIEIQSGGKAMQYWVKSNLKIVKTKTLNQRKLIFTNIAEKSSFEFILNLRENGFE
jgi:RecA/RadA recombinase